MDFDAKAGRDFAGWVAVEEDEETHVDSIACEVTPEFSEDAETHFEVGDGAEDDSEAFCISAKVAEASSPTVHDSMFGLWPEECRCSRTAPSVTEVDAAINRHASKTLANSRKSSNWLCRGLRLRKSSRR